LNLSLKDLQLEKKINCEEMKIGILSDSPTFPNLALMKISNYHKNKNDEIDWYSDLFSKQFDKVYYSKIFKFTHDNILSDNVDIGGTGYDIKKRLPEEIEKSCPDYSIYDSDFSIQYYSRGCIRNCPFCVVRQKEGYIHSVKPMPLNPSGKWIHVLDNNFFANPEWEYAINHLIKCNQPVRLDGIDIRILIKKQCEYLSKLKLKTQIHIAWDNPKEKIDEHIKRILSYGVLKPYRFMCYVLIGYWSSEEEDLYRVNKLRDMGVDPFVMPYDKKDKYQKRFARWVNHKAIFKSVEWKDYR